MKRYLVPVILMAVILLYGCGGSPEATPASTDEPTPIQTVEPTGTPSGPDRPAEVGDTVRVDYTGTLEDGTQFDTSIGREPLEFTIGSGQVITGFDNAVIGMKPGETKTVFIPMDEAYGPYREDLIKEVPLSELPDVQHEVGMQFYKITTEGYMVLVTIIGVTEDSVILDENHPLAGRDLTFEIHLIEIL